MKPHYRLHFVWFDGKTPLWWVSCIRRVRSMSMRVTTGRYVDPANAIREAARL